MLINVAHAGVISDAPSLSHVGINIFNFLLSVAGIIAIIALVIAAIMYFVSNGDQKNMQRAKRYTQYAIIGIIMVMSGMIAVNFIARFFN